MPTATKSPRKATGTLNSKRPNPYEVAYKQVWDALPRWKQLAVTEDTAAKRWDSSVMVMFTAQVMEVAEKLYAAVEKN